MRDRFQEPNADAGTTTRADLFDCGLLVSAMDGDVGEATRRHFKFPVAMTKRAKQAIEAWAEGDQVSLAVAWSALLSKFTSLPALGAGEAFAVVSIADPKFVAAPRAQRFKLQQSFDGDGQTVLTVLMPEEDV